MDARVDHFGSWRRLALYALMPAAALGAAERFSHYFGLPIDTLLRDPGAVTNTPYYVGAISNLGVILWCAAACFAFFGAMILHALGGRRRAMGFLLSGGGLSATLLLDDFFMLHESAVPHLLGVSEVVVLTFYAAWGVAMMASYWRIVFERDAEVLVAAIVLLGLSVVVDVFGGWALIVEDGLKLFGISFWCVYFALTARRLTMEASRPAPARVRRLLGPLRRYTSQSQRVGTKAKRSHRM